MNVRGERTDARGQRLWKRFMGAHRDLSLEALTSDPTESTDLVLEREDLEALRIFHRSFNLPGLRLGLINPVCADGYFPKEDEAAEDSDDCPAEEELIVDREPWIDDMPSQLAAALNEDPPPMHRGRPVESGST
eukprot:3899470-Prymnesium_polylepis.2